MDLRVGTAGWSIPRASAPRFAPGGTHLQRYATHFRCVEINSSFYRPHAATTYAKWRDSVPADFQFAVKMPRTITHELKLQGVRDPLVAFLTQTDGLSTKRGPILVQLPPSFTFDRAVANSFLELLRTVFDGRIVWEPRHESWFAPPVNALFERYRIARVAADPRCTGAVMSPGGWPRTAYYRLHGSPRTYWSRYDQRFIAQLRAMLASVPAADEVWCIFDNTASGAALENAWELSELLGP